MNDRYTVPPPPTGRHMAYDREAELWVGFWNGEPVVAGKNWQQVGIDLDRHIDRVTRKAA